MTDNIGTNLVYQSLGGLSKDSLKEGINDVNSLKRLNTPRRGLSNLGNLQQPTTDKKNRLPTLPTCTPSRIDPVSIRPQQMKRNVFVFEDTESVKDNGKEEEDEEVIDTCGKNDMYKSILCESIYDRSLILEKSVRPLSIENDAELDESIDAGLRMSNSDDIEVEIDEDENTIKGDPSLSDYFKSVHGVAENFDEMWDKLEVNLDDNWTEIDHITHVETNEQRRRQDDHALLKDYLESRECNFVQLEECEELLEMEKRLENELNFSDNFVEEDNTVYPN